MKDQRKETEIITRDKEKSKQKGPFFSDTTAADYNGENTTMRRSCSTESDWEVFPNDHELRE
jgi:hypothetical protein